MSQQPDIETHQTHRPYEAHIPPQTYTNQQHPHQTTTYFNKSVAKCVKYQTKLTHSTQLLHQQTTDALNIITKSSSPQEKFAFH